MGKHLPHRAAVGKKWGDWAVLGGLLFPPMHTEPQPTTEHQFWGREGPGMTQPALRNKSNRQGGGDFHARLLLLNPTPGSPGSCQACWALLPFLLGPLLFAGPAAGGAVESLSAKAPLSFLESPVRWIPTLSSKASLCFTVMLNRGGDCARIACATVFSSF